MPIWCERKLDHVRPPTEEDGEGADRRREEEEEQKARIRAERGQANASDARVAMRNSTSNVLGGVIRGNLNSCRFCNCWHEQQGIYRFHSAPAPTS